MKNIAALLFALIITGCAATNPSNEYAATYAEEFNGTWIGDTKSTVGEEPPFGSNNINKFPIKLVINKGQAGVFTLREDNTFKEVKKGKFKIITHKTNAIIFAQDAENDQRTDTPQKSGWVETWNFTITLNDDSSMFVYLNRCVNNQDLTHESDNDEYPARFFRSFTGKLNKVSEM
jgi:hypothetical protein